MRNIGMAGSFKMAAGKPNYRWVVAIPGRGLLIGFDGGLQTYRGYPNELNWMQVKNRGSEAEAHKDIKELRDKAAIGLTDSRDDGCMATDISWAYPRQVEWRAIRVQLAAIATEYGADPDVVEPEQGFPAANRGFIARLWRWLAMD